MPQALSGILIESVLSYNLVNTFHTIQSIVGISHLIESDITQIYNNCNNFIEVKRMSLECIRAKQDRELINELVSRIKPIVIYDNYGNYVIMLGLGFFIKAFFF
jgi:hypothetical protein